MLKHQALGYLLKDGTYTKLKLRVNMASNTKAELCQSKDGLAGSYEGTGSLAAVLCDEWQRVREDDERPKKV